MGSAPASVSVVIPSNRGGRYLAEAVASVRAQTTPVQEIILVDDGSPAPGLGTVAAELGIRFIRQSPSGLSAARNCGAVNATGRWLAFLDDDDVWYPRKIERQLAVLAAAPQPIAAYSDLTVIDPDGNPVEEVVASVGSSRHLMGLGNGVPPINTLLIRRDVYLAIGGCDVGIRYAEDIDLVLRLLQHGEFVKAPGSLVGYRKHPGQVTSDGFASMGAYIDVVRRLVRRAAREGDHETAGLLRQHLHRTLPATADWGAQEMLSRFRHGRWREAASATVWGFRHARTAFAPAVARAALRRVSESRR